MTKDRTLSRRRLLEIGGLGSLGLTLPGLLRAEDEATIASGRGGAKPIRSCILLFYYGGPSHIDTVDMKPRAPAQVRGEFGSIATNVPGMRVCEHLPHTATVMDRLAIIRSMHHPMTNHNAAAFTAMCGRNPLKGDLELLGNDRNDPPCYGAILSATLPERRGLPDIGGLASCDVQRGAAPRPGRGLPRFGARPVPGQRRPQHARLPPGRAGAARRRDARPHGRSRRAATTARRPPSPHRDAGRGRGQGRGGRSSWSGGGNRDAGAGRRPDPSDVYAEKAFRLLHSPAVRKAFDLAAEDPKLRDRYGRTKLGQSMLLARRLVESGVRFVTVYDGQYNGQEANWDAHSSVFPRLKDNLLPPADRAFAALIDDLSGRGLLEETLVIAMGEFGRTPKINGTAGRDHWPYCYSVILAGGGVRGGITFGSSDKLGAYPDTDAVTPGDLAATLFWRLGLDPTREMIDLTGRPYKLADGQPIRAIFG